MGRANRKQDTAILVLVLSAILSGAWSCPKGWETYPEDNSCIKLYLKRLRWFDTQKACREEDDRASLVQIWDERKDNFIDGLRRGMIREEPNWIGVHDADQDGTYEYLNGTKLYTTKPGLGEWQKKKETKIEVGKCAALETMGNAWIYKECHEMHFFICEIPTTDVITPGGKWKECQFGACVCQMEDWHLLPTINKYVIVSRFQTDRTKADLMCVRFGGMLLEIKDKAFEDALKGLNVWSPRGVYYWHGLSASLESGWSWHDHDLNQKEDYTKWWDYLPNDKECVVVIMGYNAFWRTTDCRNKAYVICQSDVPCSSNPSIIVSNSVTPEDSPHVRTVKTKDSVTLKCYMFGYLANVKEVQLHCEKAKLVDAGVRKTISIKEMEVSLSFHGDRCTCLVVKTEGHTESYEIKLDVQTHPLSATEDSNTPRMVIVQPPRNLTASFEVMANPKPTIFTLTQGGKVLDTDHYHVTATEVQGGEGLHYLVNVTMGKYSFNTNYQITIDNGMEGKEKLTRTFYATVASKEAQTSAVTADTLMTGVVIAGVVCCLGVGTYAYFRGSRQHSSVPEETPANSQQNKAQRQTSRKNLIKAKRSTGKKGRYKLDDRSTAGRIVNSSDQPENFVSPNQPENFGTLV